jgi:putative PIN family toxin of toxin-antitoxin system
MKVVLDTNIIISGLYSKRGASYQLLREAISGKMTFVISPLIAFEYEGKVYQKIEQDFLKVSKEDCRLFLDAFFAAAEIVWKPVQIRPILLDSSDDKILECAISGNCTHIVSFNKRHFPEAIIQPFGLEVMTAGEFLETWRNNQ